ncbi:MAG: 16S rRNA (guanine(527)-N(7))-methyltransferase RsmG [Bacteroidales bacterium]|nr:16S rRNA (guanine(527)-N(7))-methyltransferase RsmG [Bacteroidales bacterium]
MKLLQRYFPGLTDDQNRLFKKLSAELVDWNSRINVVSRKDVEHLEERHILHALAISRFLSFMPGTKIADVGTGGGFPGLPLAIMHPDCIFTLIDSVQKKIKVVNALKEKLSLSNVQTVQVRAEKFTEKHDFIVSRAVTTFPLFYKWTRHIISGKSFNAVPNGIIYLKGGELDQELAGFEQDAQIVPINKWFSEAWFDSKKIVYLPV